MGQESPLLLINGYGATKTDWDPRFLAALTMSFEAICPDSRGIGASELGTGPLTIGGLASDLEELLDALEIDRAPRCPVPQPFEFRAESARCRRADRESECFP